MKNKEIVKSVIQSFLKVDVENALIHMTDDVRMGWPGYFSLKPGKNAIREFYKDIPQILSSEIEFLVEEGDVVIGNGKMTARHDNDEIKNSFFCDVYKLENGKVKEIKSHVVFQEKYE